MGPGDIQINKTNNKLIKKNNNRRIFVGGDVRKVVCGRNARRRTADKETPRILTRLGRLRARSGSKLPAATGPLRALGMVDFIMRGLCARWGV